MAFASINTHRQERLGNPAKTRITQSILFAGFSLAYIFLAPNIFQQDWDSLMYAYWSEVKGIESIWGNHPLAHAIHNSIYALLTSLGVQGRALPVFIACNGLMSGLAVAFFFSLMKKIGTDYWFSLGYAVVFGASYGIWHYAGSADVYSLSVLLLVLAWLSLYDAVHRLHSRHLFLPGALAGLSVLAHQLNGVFFLAAAVILLMETRDRWPRLVTFYGTAAVLLLSGSFFFGAIATSSTSLPDIIGWFRGYLGEDIYGEPLSLESITLSSKVALGTILVPTWRRARFLRTALYGLLFVLVVLGTTQVRRLERGKRILLLAAFLQCLVSFLLITWFEPWYPKFWLLVLVPTMIVVALSLEALVKEAASRLENRAGWGRLYSPVLLLLPGIVVLSFNLRYAILGEHAPDAASQAAVDTWLEHSRRDDMLITAGDLIPQLWFWSGRPNTVHLYHYLVVDRDSGDRFAYLRNEIDRFLCEGHAVLYTPAILDHFGSSFLQWLDLPREELKLFFDGYQKESYFTYLNRINNEETRVYKLMNPAACIR